MKRVTLIISAIVFVVFSIQSQMVENPNIIPKVNTNNGVISLAELFENKSKYANKTIKVRGEVVKYNNAIMGKNWIHLQDGTEYKGTNDLTITSKMETKVGETVTIEGKITLNKDIGSGYFYDIIMEEAVIVK